MINFKISSVKKGSFCIKSIKGNIYEDFKDLKNLLILEREFEGEVKEDIDIE